MSSDNHPLNDNNDDNDYVIEGNNMEYKVKQHVYDPIEKKHKYLIGSTYKTKLGHATKDPELNRIRRSFDRDQVRNVRRNTKDYDNNIHNYTHNVFIGVGHKAEQPSTKTENSKVLGLIFNPLDTEAFQRLEDLYVNDPTAQQNLKKLWGLVLGNEFKLSIADTKTYDNDDDKNSNFEQILAHEEYKKARDKCRRILKKLKFRDTYHKLCILANLYGRAAAEVIRDTDTNEPVYINLLYSQLLGDPVLDKYHQLIGVEYEDLPDRPQFRKLKGSINDDHLPAFKIDKLIYYAHNDVPVTIGGKHYGIGMESLLDTSDTKRMILQNELKEWVAKSHTGHIIISTDEPLPQEELDSISTKLSNNPGSVSTFNYGVAVNSISMPTNIDQMEKIIDTLNREILRGIDIISPLGGYEHVQNFASIAKTIVVWMASTLNPMRIEHKAIIKEQFVDKIFQTCLLQQGEIILEDPETYEQFLYKVTYPLELTPRQALEQINEFLQDNPRFDEMEGFTFKQQSTPVAELMIDIDLPRFNDFAEIADKILSWVRERMMTKHKGLAMVGHEDEIDDIKLLDQQAEEKQAELMNAGIMTDTQGKPIPNFRSAATQEEILNKKGENIKAKDPKSRTRAETEKLNKREAGKPNKMDVTKAKEVKN